MIILLHEFYQVKKNSNLEFLQKFGNNLNKIRKSKGFTQAELANDLGIEISQISRIERGVINTSITNIYAISEILNIEIKEFFDFK